MQNFKAFEGKRKNTKKEDTNWLNKSARIKDDSVLGDSSNRYKDDSILKLSGSLINEHEFE
jgi:hypothetical protein